MPVLLVLEPTVKSRPQYAPLLSALDRIGARRILKTCWLIDEGTVESVRGSIDVYTPITDGVVLAEVSKVEIRKVSRI
jgi:hypothetical protein